MNTDKFIQNSIEEPLIQNSIEDPIIDWQKIELDQIIKEWGYSSKKLREYLNKYKDSKEILNNKDFSNKNGLNADIFLPYQRNRFWEGADAISRLKLAVKAEVVIIFSNTEKDFKELKSIYVIECLRLWTRINSRTTSLTKDQFRDLLNDCYNEVMNDFDNQVEYLQEKQEKLKPKKDQVLYHYTREDFEPIRYFEKRKDAYNYWIENIWPNLLEDYKKKKLNEYMTEYTNNYVEQFNKRLSFEKAEEVKKQYLVKLNKIKINKIKYRRFVSIIEKLKNGEL